MTTPVPLETFTAELVPGESIVWSGRPNPSVILHREDWFAIPFSLMWGGFAIFWLLIASGLLNWSNKPNHPFQLFAVIWGTPFVLVGQYLIWGRFIYRRWKKNRTYYALTNRRALIVEYGLTNSREVSSASLATVSVIDRRVRGDGNGSISFGGPVAGDFQFTKRSNNQTPRFPTFYDIDNADSLYQDIQRLQEEARRTTGQAQSGW